MKRSGCWLSAFAPRPSRSPTPMSPFSTPQRSISRRVTAIGSSDAGQAFLGHVLEHVLDGELEVLLRLGILGLPGDEAVDLFHVGMGEPDHGVHDPDVLRHTHARPPAGSAAAPL